MLILEKKGKKDTNIIVQNTPKILLVILIYFSFRVNIIIQGKFLRNQTRGSKIRGGIKFYRNRFK